MLMINLKQPSYRKRFERKSNNPDFCFWFRNRFTKEEAYKDAQNEMKNLQTILITGSLPYQLEIVKLDTISPSLGESFHKKYNSSGTDCISYNIYNFIYKIQKNKNNSLSYFNNVLRGIYNSWNCSFNKMES